MNSHRFGSYGIVEFADETKDVLREIAECLVPHQDDILQLWVAMQWRTWQPPGLSLEDLEREFGSIFSGMLERMRHGQLEECLVDLEESGRSLARRKFPFQALVISVHFLEESYLPYILQAGSGRTRDWLIGMDEFLHSVLAAIATSYFEEHRIELLDEAEVGRVVQEGLLTHIPRETQDLEIAHVYISARERARLGGDFLDFFSVGAGGVAFVIGDLSGHGLEAAADSVMLRSLFRGFMREHPDPARAMERTNKVLLADLKPDQFATALAAVYDSAGQMHLVSAGHPQPIMCSDRCGLLEVGGDALGIREDSTYAAQTFQLLPGATFVAYTDGLIEAGGGSGQFGELNAIRAVGESRGISAKAVAGHLIDEALRHSGGRFADDVAVLVLKRRDAQE